MVANQRQCLVCGTTFSVRPGAKSEPLCERCQVAEGGKGTLSFNGWMLLLTSALIGFAALLYGWGVLINRGANESRRGLSRDLANESAAAKDSPDSSSDLPTDAVTGNLVTDHPPIESTDDPYRAAVERARQATCFVIAPNGTGSAFCIDPRGIFVTNAHVVAPGMVGDPVELRLLAGTPAERPLEARILQLDRDRDVAILGAKLEIPIEPLQMGTSASLRLTDRVTVLGFPFGKFLAVDGQRAPAVSVNVGRVAALRNSDGILKKIQIDAPVNPGNSGGPMIDDRGQVVGIVATGIVDSGVANVIPVDAVAGLLASPLIVFRFPNQIPVWDLDEPIQVQARPITEHTRLGIQCQVGGDQPFELVADQPGRYEGTIQLRSLPESADELALGWTAFCGGNTAGQYRSRIQVLRDLAEYQPTTDEMPTTIGDPLKLPGTVQKLVVGGSGQYLLVQTRSPGSVQVIDLQSRQILHQHSIENDVLLAAGHSQFLIADPVINTLTSWTWDSAQPLRQKKIPGPVPISGIALGSSSSGPALMTLGKSDQFVAQFVDPETLTTEPVQFEFNEEQNIDLQFDGVRASRDGRLFALRATDQVVLFRLVDGMVEVSHLANVCQYSVLNENGSRLFTDQGTYSTYDGKRVSMPYSSVGRSSDDGNRYLTFAWNPSERKTIGAVMTTGYPDPLAVFPVDADDEHALIETLANDQIMLLSDQLIYVNQNRLVFKTTGQVSDTAANYLAIKSVAPNRIKQHQPFRYQVELASNLEDFQFELTTGPDGMQISPTGEITWNPTGRDLGESYLVGVRVSGTSADGPSSEALESVQRQEATQQFRVRVTR